MTATRTPTSRDRESFERCCRACSRPSPTWTNGASDAGVRPGAAAAAPPGSTTASTSVSAPSGRSTRPGDPAVESDREYTAAVSPTDEGCVVTLDLPDVDPTELAAGVDSSGGTLVVGAGSTILERVSLPRNDLEVADASFNNGILDVQLVMEDAG